jgi:hypothetical protein
LHADLILTCRDCPFRIPKNSNSCFRLSFEIEIAIEIVLIFSPTSRLHHREPPVSAQIPHTNNEQCAQWGWIAISRRVGIRNDEGGLQTEKKHDFDFDKVKYC